MRSMGLVRFYLMVLKATGYINLRLGNNETGQAMLEKLVSWIAMTAWAAKRCWKWCTSQ